MMHLQSRGFSCFHLTLVAPLFTQTTVPFTASPSTLRSKSFSSWSFSYNPSRLYLFPSHLGTASHHFLSYTFPSTSLLSIFSPFTSLNIPYGQLCNSVSSFSTFSLIAFEAAFLALFFMPLYLLLFSPEQFWHIALCASCFLETAYFASSFHHDVPSLLLLPLFFPTHFISCL